MPKKPKEPKRITRYTHDSATDPATPETGHTSLIGAEQVIALEMDNGWSEAIYLGKVAHLDAPVIVDMEPAYDPVLLWSGKRNRRQVPLLPLQRNEVVAESRIARIIERAREAASKEPRHEQTSMFADLEKALREGDKDKRVEFYTHEEGWKNKLICGDSLEVMESLIDYEDLRGKVQMIYIDPPYGISYDSNFQQRVDSAKNNDGDTADDVLTIKAFRDTWVLGVHSYLSYLAERLYLCRELLSQTGSLFVQMGMGNGHLVKAALDEVFGSTNRVSDIRFIKAAGRGSEFLDSLFDQLLWYAKDVDAFRGAYRQLYVPKGAAEGDPLYRYLERDDGSEVELTSSQLNGEEAIPDGRLFRLDPLVSEGETQAGSAPFVFRGKSFLPPPGTHWKLTHEGLNSLAEKNRLYSYGRQLRYKRYPDDSKWRPISDVWLDTQKGTFGGKRRFAVQTAQKVVERCIAMATTPGDLVLDITLGSGTTALAAEQLGRRWIGCDVSRVAIEVSRVQLLERLFESFRLRGGEPSSGFVYAEASRLQPSDVAYEREPATFDLVDRPVRNPSALRVCGPFEIMTLGRYSTEDWTGYLMNSEDGKLENYIAVLCRLYRKDASLQDSAGVIHAIEDSADGMLAISIGPISGRVSARQIYDAAEEAAALGIPEAHVLGWAFEANVGEVKSEIDEAGDVTVQLVMIRPDSLAEGLKVTKPEMLFSPLALPDVSVEVDHDRFTITLEGVALFDRKNKITEFKQADSGYVSAWYLDEDYDGDCFVDCQMFFDFKKKPAIEKTLGIEVDPEEWTLRLTSDPFDAGRYRRFAVKVVDVYGNESTVVRSLP